MLCNVTNICCVVKHKTNLTQKFSLGKKKELIEKEKKKIEVQNKCRGAWKFSQLEILFVCFEKFC